MAIDKVADSLLVRVVYSLAKIKVTYSSHKSTSPESLL
jgi:hypothetical protein